MAHEKYFDLLKLEIELRHQAAPFRQIHSIYFGGGTPSLVEPRLLAGFLERLKSLGFSWTQNCEVTIEINPATVSEAALNHYLEMGINRFSVGAQTFSLRLLELCGREHDVDDTLTTLSLLKKYNLNYSFDLLFALPTQSIAELRADLNQVIEFSPSHLSAYCLTVPSGHPMSLGRPPEEEQIEMFAQIENSLRPIGLEKYEISNFARPERASRHNLTYWSDEPYWGVGLSAHSYFHQGPWGKRFWNPKSFLEYEAQLRGNGDLPDSQYEELKKHESLTDFCHMFLRTTQGLKVSAVRQKYGDSVGARVDKIATLLTERGLLKTKAGHLTLTSRGELVSNQVFADFLFSAEDL